LRWGVANVIGEPALAARRRTGKAIGSGDEGGLGESVSPSPSLESENLSPNRRPPPMVDAAFTIPPGLLVIDRTSGIRATCARSLL